MKKLLFISLLSIFLFSCSDDKDEKYRWEIYVENTENIPCIKEFLKIEYPNITDAYFDEILYSGKSADRCMYGEDGKMVTKEESILSYVSSTFCDLTEDQAKDISDYLNQHMKKMYDNGEIDCLIEYTYKKAEPN